MSKLRGVFVRRLKLYKACPFQLSICIQCKFSHHALMHTSHSQPKYLLFQVLSEVSTGKLEHLESRTCFFQSFEVGVSSSSPFPSYNIYIYIFATLIYSKSETVPVFKTCWPIDCSKMPTFLWWMTTTPAFRSSWDNPETFGRLQLYGAPHSRLTGEYL